MLSASSWKKKDSKFIFYELKRKLQVSRDATKLTKHNNWVKCDPFHYYDVQLYWSCSIP